MIENKTYVLQKDFLGSNGDNGYVHRKGDRVNRSKTHNYYEFDNGDFVYFKLVEANPEWFVLEKQLPFVKSLDADVYGVGFDIDCGSVPLINIHISRERLAKILLANNNNRLIITDEYHNWIRDDKAFAVVEQAWLASQNFSGGFRDYILESPELRMWVAQSIKRKNKS